MRVPDRSNSGSVSDLERAVSTAETIPSTPVRVIKCCMLGVSRNGTDSVDEMIGLLDEVAAGTSAHALKYGCGRHREGLPGKISVMYMLPVFLESWKRVGDRPCRQHMYVRNMLAAACVANCLRMSHRLSGVFIVLIMYCHEGSALCRSTVYEVAYVGEDVFWDHLGLNLLHDFHLELDEPVVRLYHQGQPMRLSMFV